MSRRRICRSFSEDPWTPYSNGNTIVSVQIRYFIPLGRPYLALRPPHRRHEVALQRLFHRDPLFGVCFVISHRPY